MIPVRFVVVVCATLVLTLGLAMVSEPPAANVTPARAFGFLLCWAGLLLVFMAVAYLAGKESK